MPVTPKTANGWGSVHNGGITGGTGGIEVSFSNFFDMWIWLSNNLTVVAIVTYTGPDFSRIGFALNFPNSTFSNSSRFEIIGVQNKTIEASAGQLLTMCNIRFRDNQNIIWQNWRHFDSLDDLIGIQSDSINIWVRHCELDANSFNQSFAQVDGNLDIILRSDFIAVTDCWFRNGDKTCLVSSSNSDTNDRGKLRISFMRNKWDDCIQRLPFARFGKIGLHFNRVDTQVIPHLSGGSKVIQVGFESQIYSHRNDYRRGRWLFSDEGSGGDGGVISNGDRIGTFVSNTTPINPSYVTWNPLTTDDYTIDDWTDEQMDAWLDNWVGAKMHLMNDEVTYNLTLSPSNESLGTVSRSGSNPVTSGGTVQLTATPIGSGVFQGWYEGSVGFGNLISANNPHTITMNSNRTIIGSFSDGTPVPPEQPRKKFAKKRQIT